MSNQFDLSNFVDNGDGTFSKKKSTPQPREIKNYIDNKGKEKDGYGYSVGLVNFAKREQIKSEFRTITLTLFGEPMPKQSVRGYASGRKNKNGILIVDTFQPPPSL